MKLQFRPASRKAVPMLISISSVSGGGKTFSALLLAAGLAGENGRVGMIDTENGRGEMYTDSPGIKAALPNKFEYLRLDPPFPPDSYVEAIKAAEAAGLTVVVIDSTSHEWEGTGGCCEIAEKNKLRNMPNWSKAKLEHKKFLNHCLSSNLHIIFCLRAREKVKITADSQIIPQGLQSICEKSFEFEQLLSFRLEAESHHAIVLKAPEPLRPMFTSGHLITKLDGEKIRKWNEGGLEIDPKEQLQKRARLAADGGMESYKAFFAALSKPQQKTLADTTHDENKELATQADLTAKSANEEPPPIEKYNSTASAAQAPLPATMKAIEAFEPELGTKVYQSVLDANFFENVHGLIFEANAQIVLKAMQEESAKSKGK